jgi:hypothetical protein
MRTPEQQASSLGARFACEAFNACGSLDARKCQELGDKFGEEIAELVSDRLSPEARSALEAGLASAVRGEVKPFEIPEDSTGATDSPAGKAWSMDRYGRIEPSYLQCFVCGKLRDLQVRELCGHDTDSGTERRWYCSRECFDR